MDDGGLRWARGFADHLAEAVARDAGASWRAFQTGAAIKPGHAVAGVALEIMVEHGDALEERHDLLVPAGHRALMEALPAKRREAVVLRHLDLLSRAPDICNASASFVPGPMAEPLPLCPKPKIATALRELASQLEACERVTSEDRQALDAALAAVT
ncbi:MAG TPA: hypothetical protein ENK57_04365 [Polyangiaceae bacterium]|nr:hypothetical protein [Polyangiaceae bacterium]